MRSFPRNEDSTLYKNVSYKAVSLGDIIARIVILMVDTTPSRERTVNTNEPGQTHPVGKALTPSPSKAVGEKRKEVAGNPFARKSKVAKQ